MSIMKCIYIGDILALLMLFVPCQAQEKSQIVPDFKGYFEAMNESRALYNQYSDSLFLVKNKKEWTDLVKRRTHVTQRLLTENAKRQEDLLQACRRYGMSGDSLSMVKNDRIPLKPYADLFDYIHKQVYSKKELDNPLTLIAVCDVFNYGGKRVVDSLKCINVLNTWKLYSFIKLANLGGNTDYLKKAYEYGKFILSDEAKKYPYHDYALSQALRYMPKTIWIVRHVGTVAEYRGFCHKLDEFLARTDIHQIVSPNLYAELKNIQETADEALVRNTYLAGDTVLSKQEADSLMEKVIQKNMNSPHVPCLSYIRTLFMMMQMGKITANEAREECLRRYHLNWEKIKGKRLNSKELNDYLQPFYTFFYLNYKATVPFEEKRQTVVDMSQDIASVYFNRLDHEGTTDYVRDLLGLSTYDKVMMYLTPQEVTQFLTTMNVASQAVTFARSSVSAIVAQAIMKDVLRLKPELLVGQLGCNSVDEVKKKSKDFLKFIKEAALYHDLGMNSVASVTKSEFRPMFKIEQEIYERHPEYGLQYLQLTPALQKFKDITLGHHKWYDGKGGYPTNFDNTKSPIRILIDIVHQSDALLEITKQMGSKLPPAEVANAVVDELKAGAGTRFNPDLVNLMMEHPHVEERIREYVEHGWANEYYQVFKENFFDRD